MDDSTLDFGPSTTTVATLVRGVRDDQLTGPTPCPDYTVADLLDHIGGLSLAFRCAADKERPPGDGAPDVDGSRLEDGWRELIVGRLDALATAWRQPGAFEGITQAGPIEMPAPAAALVALDEIVVHGWDLARSLGREYDADPAAVAACRSFVDSFEPPADGAADDGGLFGPPVAVPGDASDLDRLIGATGRDPGWTP
jgi:uncharacterized protein (TIGR03086 family)